MGATIRIFNNGQYVGKTSKAYNCKIKHELMRMYLLNFSISNSNSIFPYINSYDDIMFIADGQRYDLSRYSQESGTDNVTSVEAQHVGYRLNNYLLPIGYSFVGTIEQIAQDLLNQAKNESGIPASSEFSIGTAPNLGTISFSLNNTDTVTAKYAIMALKNIGAESDFDNFMINFYAKIGNGNTELFQFGVNMQKVKITYDKSNGSTYDIDIVDLQQIPGHEGDVFDIGYYGSIIDSITGKTFTKRIITYTRCLDDRTQNSITLGVFVSDVSTQTTQMQVDIGTAQSTANAAADSAANSVQQGVSYSNVSISHTDGFKASHVDGSYTQMNADGLKRHLGSTNVDYHYLMYTGQQVVESSLYDTEITISAPDEFKGKNFSVITAVQNTGNTTETGLANLWCAINSESIDPVNGTFKVRAYARLTDPSIGNGYVNIQFSYTLIA